MATTRLQFSFLTSGPAMQVDTDASVQSLPELSSPVINGAGGRSFTFSPNPQGAVILDGLRAQSEFLTQYETRDARIMFVYRRIEEPLLWWLLWELPNGCVASHLREQDGADQAAVTASALEIIDEPPTPTLLLGSPLLPAVSDSPGYVESAFFLPRDASTQVSLRFIRPGFLADGQFVTNVTDNWVTVRAGAGEGTEAQIFMPGTDVQEAQTLLAATVSTFSSGAAIG